MKQQIQAQLQAQHQKRRIVLVFSAFILLVLLAFLFEERTWFGSSRHDQFLKHEEQNKQQQESSSSTLNDHRDHQFSYDLIHHDKDENANNNNTQNENICDQSAYSFTVGDENLNLYQGHVTLFVNTASFCGFTSRGYRALAELQHHYASNNELVKFALFPANEKQFLFQEPAPLSEIKRFAATRFGVQESRNLHFFGKTHVVGEHQHPLWKFFEMCSPGAESTGDHKMKISWNWNWVLVDIAGRVRARYPPGSTGEQLMANIDRLLNNLI